MSKVKVDRALERAALGDAEGARQALHGVSAEYLDKRLGHLAADGRLAPSVSALREILAGREAAPVTPQKGEAAPEAPPASRFRAVRLPQRMTLTEAALALRALSVPEPCEFQFDDARLIQMWVLVGVAARARDVASVQISGLEGSSAGRFAHAVGLRELVEHKTQVSAGERGRTHKLTRVTSLSGVEEQSRAIARLMLPSESDDEVRKTIQYVLVELFRNVLQHSQDRLGGVVGAQLMEPNEDYPKPVMQVAVGDSGIGIPTALSDFHPGLVDPRAALAKALEPHISGTFEEGRTGSRYNAGMGLFFISEMAKLTAGRLMIATRDAALYLEGDPEFEGRHQLRFLQPDGVGYPGTLVAFELPLGNVEEHDSLLSAIRNRAEERTPPRNVQRILRYESPPPGVGPIQVRLLAENAVAAEELSRNRLVPMIQEGKPIALDFRGMEICTQSFLHALLFRPLRYSWAERVPIYVANAEPAVLTGLQLVEGYALRG
ncbi:MAG TPA: STAS-like domain-containing protein [Myxococcota bacterium]|nr:STAS-like domain-containing protein [Myxococcota bacterium]